MDPAADYYYWGAPTARLNFGEVDYLESAYIAEPYNTFSSLVFTWLGVVGWRAARRAHLPLYVAAAHGAMAVTGFASALFHATLQFHFHIFDEIAESWIVLVLLYTVRLFPNDESPRGDSSPRSPATSLAFQWPLFFLHGLIMSVLIYCIMGFCEVHLVAVAAYVAIRIVRTMKALERRMEHRQRDSRSTTVFGSGASSAQLEVLATTLRYGSIFLLLGVSSWLLEVIFSGTIAQLQMTAAGSTTRCIQPMTGGDGGGRLQAEAPTHVYALAVWRMVQLHACWHLFMALATYMATVVVAVLHPGGDRQGEVRRHGDALRPSIAVAHGLFGLPTYAVSPS